MKTSHELARELLELPDVIIQVSGWKPGILNISIVEFGMEHTQVAIFHEEEAFTFC